jgi:hypothetical protein
MEKVRSGEAVSIKASTWNAFVDAAEYVRTARTSAGGGGVRSGLGGGVVAIRNASGKDLGRFAALAVSGVCVTPDSNEDEFVSCLPTLEGVCMTEDLSDGAFAVLLEPVAADAVGRAVVSGIVPAKVTVGSAGHGYAVPTVGSSTGAMESAASGYARILWAGTGDQPRWCLLQLGGGGGGAAEGDTAVMCQVTGGSAAAGYTVAAYPNGRSDEGGKYGALLLLPDVALDAEIPNGTWIVGHKCLMAATGGAD